jgi:hypothetical protein
MSSTPVLKEDYKKNERCEMIKMKVLICKTENKCKTMETEHTDLLKSWTLIKEKI